MSNQVIPAGTPTQLAHKAQAVKRTVTVVILALIVANGIIALLVEVFGVYLGDVNLGYLAAASAFIAALVTFLQRLLLIESWQPLLTKLGIGTGVEDEPDFGKAGEVPSFKPMDDGTLQDRTIQDLHYDEDRP